MKLRVSIIEFLIILQTLSETRVTHQKNDHIEKFFSSTKRLVLEYTLGYALIHVTFSDEDNKVVMNRSNRRQKMKD